MSRATVRAAVTAHLDGQVTNLNAVHSAKPRSWKTTENRYDGTQPSAAVGYVHIESVVDRRAATGKRFLEYTVGLVFLFKSRRTDSEQMMDEFDELVEAIKARLRLRPPLGVTDGTIFEAAEHLLEDLTDEPQKKASHVAMWGVIRFDVSEWINA